MTIEVAVEKDLLEDDSPLSRQSMLVPQEIGNTRALIIGTGGIGSNVIHVLASMGVKEFYTVEFDSVSPANVHPGFFMGEDAYARHGVPKSASVTEAVNRIIGDTDISVINIAERVEDLHAGGLPPVNIIIIGTDSLPSRRIAFRRLFQHGKGMTWIDGRMGGAGCDVYVYHDELDQDSKEHYYASLEGEGDPLPCGMKATSAMTKGYIPGIIGDIVRDWVSGLLLPYHVRYSMDDKGFLWRYKV